MPLRLETTPTTLTLLRSSHGGAVNAFFTIRREDVGELIRLLRQEELVSRVQRTGEDVI